jgi:hypothetical protein
MALSLNRIGGGVMSKEQSLQLVLVVTVFLLTSGSAFAGRPLLPIFGDYAPDGMPRLETTLQWYVSDNACEGPHGTACTSGVHVVDMYLGAKEDTGRQILLGAQFVLAGAPPCIDAKPCVGGWLRPFRASILSKAWHDRLVGMTFPDQIRIPFLEDTGMDPDSPMCILSVDTSKTTGFWEAGPVTPEGQALRPYGPVRVGYRIELGFGSASSCPVPN